MTLSVEVQKILFSVLLISGDSYGVRYLQLDPEALRSDSDCVRNNFEQIAARHEAMPFQIPNEFERQHEAYLRILTGGSRRDGTIPEFRALAEILVTVWVYDESQIAKALAARRDAVHHQDSGIAGRIFPGPHNVPGVSTTGDSRERIDRWEPSPRAA